MNTTPPSCVLVWTQDGKYLTRSFRTIREAEDWLENEAPHGHFTLIGLSTGDNLAEYRVETRRTMTQIWDRCHGSR